MALHNALHLGCGNCSLTTLLSSNHLLLNFSFAFSTRLCNTQHVVTIVGMKLYSMSQRLDSTRHLEMFKFEIFYFIC